MEATNTLHEMRETVEMACMGQLDKAALRALVETLSSQLRVLEAEAWEETDEDA